MDPGYIMVVQQGQLDGSGNARSLVGFAGLW